MTDETEKQGRPPGIAEGTDPDLPQDPGIPGDRAEDEQAEWEPADAGRPFPGSHDERAKRAAADADDSLAPGSMPPDRDERA